MTDSTMHNGAAGLTRRPRILIAGLGNDLLSDDGAGVHAVRLLKQQDLEPGVRAFEIGTAVLDALHLFEKADYIVAVDAMQASGAPGTVYQLDAHDLAMRDRVSMHDFTFTSALALLRKQPLQTAVVGVEPEKIEFGLELTPRVHAALPVAAETVRRIIRNWVDLPLHGVVESYSPSVVR